VVLYKCYGANTFGSSNFALKVQRASATHSSKKTSLKTIEIAAAKMFSEAFYALSAGAISFSIKIRQNQEPGQPLQTLQRVRNPFPRPRQL
jgi:hypothetical protein